MKKLYIPPTLIAYCAILMLVCFVFLPQYNMIKFPFNLIGLLIAFLGFYLMGKVRDMFKKYETTLKIETSRHLIDEGVFSKSRNPMYLGMFFLIIGFSLFSTNVISLLLPFAFLMAVRLIFVPKEEKLMLEQFGNNYLEYKKKVRMWI